MGFLAFWRKLLVANPDLRSLDTKVTISVEEFQRHLEKAFQQGHSEGQTTANKRKSLFESVFGR